MNFDAIPDELKARPQWLVWRAVVREDGRVTKPPHQARAPNYPADATNPNHWATFDQAVQCLRDNPTTVHGIGYAFADDDEFFGFDIDDEAKVAPEALEARRSLVTEILKNTTTYAEVSPSGTGLHIIGKGRIGGDGKGRVSTPMQIEIYDRDRYFTITGDIYNGRDRIVEQQDLIDFIFKDLADRAQHDQSMVGDIEGHRRLDLTDEEVIREASNLNPSFAPRFNAQTGCEPGRWSETFIAVIGVLDQITGKVDQIKRIVMRSPMVQAAPPSNAGESREAKAERNFTHVLGRVRGNNTVHMSHVAHGRAIMEAINAKRAEDAKRIADEILKHAEESFSKHGINLLKAFPLDPKYLKLNAPPGIVGRFCHATAAACYNPYLKFAIPSTLATLSGIVSRAYKLPNGKGLNTNFILAAPSATGKTQTMDAWESFLDRAGRQVNANAYGTQRTRLLKASASSIQGIFPDFMETPSAVWFISECASQLAQMSSPKSTTDGQLRDAYNDLYDISSMGKFLSPPRSTANRKADLVPIENLSISTYWTTTTSKFDVHNDDAQDGFLSRVTVIRHSGAAGEAIPDWDVVRHLNDDLHEILVTRLLAARTFDETMQVSPQEALKAITTVSTAEVEGQVWAYRQICEQIKNASLAGHMPVAYTAASRLPVTAMRLAGLLAVMDNPFSPAITVEQFEWAFGYLLQNSAALLSDMDTGELGADKSMDIDVVIREMKKIMRANKASGVTKTDLGYKLRRIKPFKDAHNPGEALKKTILEMMASDLIVEIDQPSNGQRGRPSSMYCPTENSLWR